MRARAPLTALLLGVAAAAQAPSNSDSAGTPGNWNGCRGNGLAVCAELVDAEYFVRHKACRPNKTCARAYFTCNHQCPPPGSARDELFSGGAPNGTPGNWAACQGDGLAVCAELVDPDYFETNKGCRSNKTCDGKYYLCNERCPPPMKKAKSGKK